MEVTVCIDRIKTAFSAFLRGSPRAVPHGGRQEGSAETRASFLQEWRAGGRQSGTTSLPGKVTKKNVITLTVAPVVVRRPEMLTLSPSTL